LAVDNRTGSASLVDKGTSWGLVRWADAGLYNFDWQAKMSRGGDGATSRSLLVAGLAGCNPTAATTVVSQTYDAATDLRSA
jgi:hypothetical protein